MALAFEIDATFRTKWEAVMWKITTITTHDFTLEEVLIMVAMNVQNQPAGWAHRQLA